MQKAIMDSATGACVGFANEGYKESSGQVLATLPQGFNIEQQSQDLVWDGTTLSIDPNASLNREKANKITAIKAERDRRKFNGVYVDSVAKWFHTDTYSRTQWLGMSMLGASVPAVAWTTMDGTTTTITPLLVQSVCKNTMQFDATLFNHARDLIDSVAACTTVQAVQDLDISTGWANTFVPA